MVKGMVNMLWVFRQAFGRYKTRIIALAVFGFLAGLLEGIGVNALIPLFSFASGGGDAGTDFVSKQIGNFFSLIGLPLTVRFLLIFIALLFGGKALLTILLDYLRLRIITDYEQETRRSLFSHMLQANWPHLMKQKLGHLETIMAVDVTNAAALLGQVGSGITVVTGLIIYIFIAFNISAAISLMTIGLGLFIFIGQRPLLKRVRALAQERNLLMKETAHHVSENVLGMKTVKAMRVEEAVSAKGQSLFDRLKRSALMVPFLKSIAGSVTEPIAVVFVSLIFAFTYRRPDFSLVVLIAIVYLIHRMFIYIQQFQGIAHAIGSFTPFLQSIVNYEREANTQREAVYGEKPFLFKSALRFESVSFGYETDKTTLKDLDFVLKKGEFVGIIGPSGVGKTTITDLLLRLLEPSSGRITLDEVPAGNVAIEQWRRHIGYMSQDMFLLNDTVKANIRFYDLGITDAEIKEAARLANVDKVIDALPQGYDTVIGERGLRLSAGERQRVVLARVLARKPELLILDEATSALDNESEAQVQAVLKNLKGKITVLAIAHRLSTLADADRLIALEGGRISEEGSPKDLLQDKTSYFFRANNIIGI